MGYVLWSWHLWFCKGYDPVRFQQTYRDGNLVDVKTNVKVWSCTLNGSSAAYTMTADGVSAKFNGTSHLNGAASVRCVKE